MQANPDFDPHSLEKKVPFVASQLYKAYDHRIILDGVNISLDSDSRIVLIGTNGAGKSSLLKILAGIEKPDSGEITVASGVRIGYLDQEQETLDLDQTLFDPYREGLRGLAQEIRASLLSYGFFVFEDTQKLIRNLSIGQRRKLQIAQLIQKRANVLLLDEPTNHLSLNIVEEFENALLAFPGPVLAISHDRRFIKRFAKEIWELHDGKVVPHSVAV